ncbi:MAG: hypothetical protein AAF750_07105 [Planctomycetota bacterium]
MDESGTFEPLHPEVLTWAALLGRWVEFAEASVALPTEGEPGLLKASVVDVITLQAVCCALGELGELGLEERALGRDRAGVLVERHAGVLRRRWSGAAMPEALVELVEEAEAAVAEARGGGEAGAGKSPA